MKLAPTLCMLGLLLGFPLSMLLPQLANPGLRDANEAAIRLQGLEPGNCVTTSASPKIIWRVESGFEPDFHQVTLRSTTSTYAIHYQNPKDLQKTRCPGENDENT